MTNIIRVIDFETTAKEPPEAVVIEAGRCDLIGAENGWVVEAPKSELFFAAKVPPETRAVHHITTADIAGRPPFDPVAFLAQAVADGVTVIAAHNAAFELLFLPKEFSIPVLCTYKAALRLWPTAPGHSNSCLRYWLEDEGYLKLDSALAMPPHRAAPDAYVTAHILKAMLMEETGRQMVAWTREPALLPHCPIGKFRGKPWAEVEAGFLEWVLKQADMEADLKWNANRELLRRRTA